jgi:hypothetical protein
MMAASSRRTAGESHALRRRLASPAAASETRSRETELASTRRVGASIARIAEVATEARNFSVQSSAGLSEGLS